MSRQVDLVPRKTTAKRTSARRVVRLAAVSAALTFGVLLVGLGLKLKAGKLDSSMEPLRQNVATMQAWADKLSPLTAKLETAAKRQRIVNGLLDEPFWCGLLSDLADASGGQVWLNGLVISKESAETDGEDLQVNGVRISGTAASHFHVIRFVERLSASESIAQLSIDALRMSPAEGVSSTVGFEMHAVAR